MVAIELPDSVYDNMPGLTYLRVAKGPSISPPWVSHGQEVAEERSTMEKEGQELAGLPQLSQPPPLPEQLTLRQSAASTQL